jgi:hypothetical protein
MIDDGGTNAVITWANAPGYVLPLSTALEGNSWRTNGTWTTVPGATSPYSASIGNPLRFYRLRQ